MGKSLSELVEEIPYGYKKRRKRYRFLEPIKVGKVIWVTLLVRKKKRWRFIAGSHAKLRAMLQGVPEPIFSVIDPETLERVIDESRRRGKIPQLTTRRKLKEVA